MTEHNKMPGGKDIGRATTVTHSGGMSCKSTRKRVGNRSRSRSRSSRGKRSRSDKRLIGKRASYKKGGSILATAALPFSLFGLHKFFQSSNGKEDLKTASKVVSKSVRKVRRSL